MTPLPRDRVLDVLTSLVDKSLVVYEERDGVGRYRLLETVGQYAGERLRESGEATDVRERHLFWCLALAEEAEPQLKGPEQTAWLARLEAEHDNLRGALAWSDEDASPERALRLAAALHFFWFSRGHLSEGRRHLETALARAETEPGTRARALQGVANMARDQGDHGSALSLYEQSLAIHRETGSRSGEADNLLGLGTLAWYQGDHGGAQPLLELSLEISREIGDLYGEAASLQNLGNVAFDQSQLEAAHAFWEQALAISREIESRYLEGTALLSLGRIPLAQGVYETAQVFFEQALAISREIGNRQVEAVCLQNLGVIAWNQGGGRSARAFFEQALATSREIGSRAREAENLINLGEVTLASDDREAARDYYQQSLALSRRIGSRHVEALSLNALASLTLREGALTDARALYAESLAISRQTRLLSLLTDTVEECAPLALAEADAPRAARLLGAAQAGREATSAALTVDQREAHEQTRAASRAALGEDAFAEAWEAGRAMTLEEAAEYALAEQGVADAAPTP